MIMPCVFCVQFHMAGVSNTRRREYAGVYVAKDGKIGPAKASSLTFRPTGNSTIPPLRGDFPPGLRMEIDRDEEGFLDIDIVNMQLSIFYLNYFRRWIGSLTGSIRV